MSVVFSTQPVTTSAGEFQRDHHEGDVKLYAVEKVHRLDAALKSFISSLFNASSRSAPAHLRVKIHSALFSPSCSPRCSQSSPHTSQGRGPSSLCQVACEEIGVSGEKSKWCILSLFFYIQNYTSKLLGGGVSIRIASQVHLHIPLALIIFLTTFTFLGAGSAKIFPNLLLARRACPCRQRALGASFSGLKSLSVGALASHSVFSLI